MKLHCISFLVFASQSVSSFVLPLVGKQVLASSRSLQQDSVTFVNSEKVFSLWATTDAAAEDTSLQRDADVIFTIIDTCVINKYRNMLSVNHFFFFFSLNFPIYYICIVTDLAPFLSRKCLATFQKQATPKMLLKGSLKRWIRTRIMKLARKNFAMDSK